MHTMTPNSSLTTDCNFFQEDALAYLVQNTLITDYQGILRLPQPTLP